MNTRLMRDRAISLEKIGSLPPAMAVAFVEMLHEAASEIDRLQALVTSAYDTLEGAETAEDARDLYDLAQAVRKGLEPTVKGVFR